MVRSASNRMLSHNCRRPNALALLVAIGAAGFLYLNVDPITAGSDPEGAIALLDQATSPPPPPLPTLASESGTAASSSTENANVLTGRWALLMHTMLLETGAAKFENVADYTATLHKQERIGESLGEVQVLKVKMRHEPFSVYMKWQTFDKGRELIYVDGQNDGNMLVQPGGWKGRVTGTLALDPAGKMAMSESRHPVTEAGLVRLARKLLGYNYTNLKRNHGWCCELHANQKHAGRDCFVFIMCYDSPEQNSTYRKTVQHVDAELSLPVAVRNYTWGEVDDPNKLDEETLLESYSWSDIRIDQRLAGGDFDTSNASYRFQKR